MMISVSPGVPPTVVAGASPNTVIELAAVIAEPIQLSSRPSYLARFGSMSCARTTAGREYPSTEPSLAAERYRWFAMVTLPPPGMF